ncbi:MAG: polyprenyl synthetase family protein [bacterium]|nr:polyprenyl synthetase family protein [bacterium]
MDKSQKAWQYLKTYQSQTTPLLTEFFDQKLNEAKQFGQVPYLACQHYAKLMMYGKKLRGSFVKLGYQLGGGQAEDKILDASLFIELFHTAVLIHDDIMDQDNLRRGQKSMHACLTDYGCQCRHPDPNLFGIANAINIGDTGFYLSWQKLLSARFNRDLVLEAAQVYTDYIIRLTYGQILDVSNITKWQTDDDEILKIFRYKTAEYTGCLPLVIGYILSGEKNPAKRQALFDYGLAFGWIFQIQDDILGIFANQQKLGKPLGSDLIQAKNTILVWHVINKAQPAYKKHLQSLIGRPNINQNDIEKARQIFKDSGALDYAQKLAKKYFDRGLKLIPKIATSPEEKELLESFLHLVMTRQQ